jgi:hypothetical protein
MPTVCIAYSFDFRFSHAGLASLLITQQKLRAKISFFSSSRGYEKKNIKFAFNIGKNLYISPPYVCNYFFFSLVQQITTQASSVCSRSAFHTFTIFYFISRNFFSLSLSNANWQNSQKFLSVTANCNFLSCKHTRGTARVSSSFL